jgi:DNA-binding cell septation regulator SpoVG
MQHTISEVQIVPIKSKDGLVGFASFVIYNAFYIGSVGIYLKLNGNGYRLTYPTRKRTIGNLNICHPINKEIATAIEQAVARKFETVMQ